MKRYLGAIGATAIIGLAFMLTTSNDTLAEPVPTAPANEFSTVVNPQIPASYTLCGEKIDLDRVDM